MANTAISGFTTAAPTDNDVVPFAQSPFGAGTNRKFTLSGLVTYLKTALAGYFSGGGPMYLSNNWYWPYLGCVPAAGTVTGTAGTINFIPITIQTPVTFKAAFIRVTTLAAGGNIAIGIYANDNTLNKPTGNPLATVSGLSTATATTVSASLSANVTLQPGIYWLATQPDNTTSALQVPSNTSPGGAYLVGAASIANASAAANLLGPQSVTTAGTYPTMPNMTAVTPTVDGGNRGGAVWLQVN
jgi:hypothetical protein